MEYGFTLEELLSMPASELAEFLDVDLYVAKIICGAARRLSNYNYHTLFSYNSLRYAPNYGSTRNGYETRREDNMTTVITTCSTCNKNYTAITDPECGEIICSNCGVVISEKMEDISNQERPAFSIEEADKRARTGDSFFPSPS